jgi:hypothetical protein
MYNFIILHEIPIFDLVKAKEEPKGDEKKADAASKK